MKGASRTLTDKEVTHNLLHQQYVDETIRYLYSAYYESTRYFILQNSGVDQDAEDIFQEAVVAFIHLVQQERFRGDATIKTFLFSLTRNMWFNELKRRGRAERREARYEAANLNNEKEIEAVLENREAHRQLLQAVDELGENCKKILLLYYYENLSMKEIVQTVNYENEQVVRNKKYKCLKKLEEMITGNKRLLQQLKTLL